MSRNKRFDHCHLLQVHLMYEEVASVPQSPLVSLLSPHMMTDPEIQVLDMDTMTLTGGETELSILSPGTPGHQYIVCAELRLADVTLQTECFLTSLDTANGSDKYYCYCAIKIFFCLSIRSWSECHHRNKSGSSDTGGSLRIYHLLLRRQK